MQKIGAACIKFLMTGKLRGAVIGCGAIAREHLAALKTLDNVDVVAVCDLSPVRAEATADRFGISKWYINHEQLVAEKPDLVHITTPPSSHFPLAKAFLSAGLNVLCEKPITTEYKSFQILRQVAAENGCVLMEDQNFRFHSSIRRLVEFRDAGKLGDILDVQICINLNFFAF